MDQRKTLEIIEDLREQHKTEILVVQGLREKASSKISSLGYRILYCNLPCGSNQCP